MELRDDQGKNGRDGLKDKCESKDGEIDDDQDDPSIAISSLSAFQMRLLSNG
jgi:hypothetical protein